MMLDNLALFEEYDKQREKALKKSPICLECGEHIQQDSAVKVCDGYICDHCLEDLRVELMWGDW